MKTCKKCGEPRGHENPLISLCKKCAYEKQASKPIKIYDIKKTPVKKMGKKRTSRIEKQGSEYKIYVEIWYERDHICENCGKQINLFHASCFAHKLNKRDHPELRYDKNNIALVHGIWEVKDQETGLTYDCHKEFDLKFNKQKHD